MCRIRMSAFRAAYAQRLRHVRRTRSDCAWGAHSIHPSSESGSTAHGTRNCRRSGHSAAPNTMKGVPFSYWQYRATIGLEIYAG